MNDYSATLTLMEDSDMDVFWECDVCGGLSKPTRAIEQDRRCRSCGAYVVEFVDELNEE